MIVNLGDTFRFAFKRFRENIVLFVLLLFSFSNASAVRFYPLQQRAVGLDDLLTPEGEFWEMLPDEFMGAYENSGFTWISDVHDTAVAPLGSVKLFGMPVFESVVRFEDNLVSEITCFIYNRGSDHRTIGGYLDTFSR